MSRYDCFAVDRGLNFGLCVVALVVVWIGKNQLGLVFRSLMRFGRFHFTWCTFKQYKRYVISNVNTQVNIK